jgi:hypothetical protein
LLRFKKKKGRALLLCLGRRVSEMVNSPTGPIWGLV